MRELAHVYRDGKRVGLLLAVVVLNLILFVAQQRTERYGLESYVNFSNYTDVTFDESGNIGDGMQEADREKSYRAYRELLAQYKSLPTGEAGEKLYKEKSRLALLAECSIIAANRQQSFYAEQYGSNRAIYGPLMEQVESGKITKEEVIEQSIAAKKLLEQIDYLEQYPGYLQAIEDSREKLRQFAVFGGEDTFTVRNIEKTAADFAGLEGAALSLGCDGAVTALLAYKGTDYLLLVCLLLVCMSFWEERQRGLWPLCRSAAGGRGALAVRRIGVVGVSAAACTVLLYGANLLAGFLMYGGAGELGRAAQSVLVLKEFPLRMSLLGFLVYYFIERLIMAFLLGMLLWTLLFSVRQVKYVLPVLFACLLVEYGLYSFLPEQNIFNLFKYYNIFSLIHLSGLYTNYLNISLFGNPVGVRESIEAAVPFLSAAACAAAVWEAEHRKPLAERSVMAGLLDRCMAGRKRVKVQGLLRREVGKLLGMQRGIWFILAALLVVGQASFASGGSEQDPVKLVMAKYLEEVQGPLGAVQDQKLNELARQIREEKSQFQVIQSAALGQLQSRVTELRHLGAKEKKVLWLLQEQPFQKVYGREAESVQIRTGNMAAVFLALVLGGCYCVERQSGMDHLMRAAPDGRKRVHRCKMAQAGMMAAVFLAMAGFQEIRAFYQLSGGEGLEAPVQSLSVLGDFPLPCSIGGFLAVLYLYRFFVLLAIAWFVCLISAKSKRAETAVLTAATLLVLPSVLAGILKLDFFKYLQAAYWYTGETAFFQFHGNGLAVAGIWLAVATAAGLLYVRTEKSFL